MKAAGNQAKTACKSLQLCAGLDSRIKRETHVVEQRRRERTAPDPGGGADEGSEGSEDKSSTETSGKEKVG